MSALRPKLGVGEKIRVLIVDDSVVMRSIISHILEGDDVIQVIGVARDGVDALAKVRKWQPHVVTLDVEMPELDGLGALRQIVASFPNVRVIMVSSLTARGSQVTVEALIAGAVNYVMKPMHGSSSADRFHILGRELLAKIRELFVLEPSTELPMGTPKIASIGTAVPESGRSPEVFAIGVSTGGPTALAELLPNIPKNFPLPIVIVQHMPPLFTKLLAQRLAVLSQISVLEGEDDMVLEPGCAVLAPGGYHMRLVRSGPQFRVKLDMGPQENSCRPAVDVLLRSLAECLRGRAIVAILTGMGQDGLAGVRILKAMGATIIAQDRPTSVIWGMPGAIVTADLADLTLPLNKIVPEVLARVRCR